MSGGRRSEGAQQDALRLSVDTSPSLLSASAFWSLGYTEAEGHLCASYSMCTETSLSLILSATSQDKGAHYGSLAWAFILSTVLFFSWWGCDTRDVHKILHWQGTSPYWWEGFTERQSSMSFEKNANYLPQPCLGHSLQGPHPSPHPSLPTVLTLSTNL